MSRSPQPTGFDAALILDTAREAFIAMDRDGHVREWNRAACDTFGWSRAEALGAELAELIIPEELQGAHRAGLARFLDTREGPVLDKRVELPALHRSGRRLTVEITISAPVTDDGVFFHAFAHDITERTRRDRFQRAHLAVTEALAIADASDMPHLVLGALAEAGEWSYAGWWAVDPEADTLRRYVAWNRDDDANEAFAATSQTARFSRGDGIPGRAWELGEAIWVEDLSVDRRGLRGPAAGAAGLRAGVVVPLRIGSEVVGLMEFFGESPRSEDPTLIAHLTAVTAQVAQFVARSRAERRAAEVQDAFVANISHELRTPLTSIMGFAQTALDHDFDAAQWAAFMQIIHQQSQRLGRLVEDLLDMSRLQSGAVQLVLAPVDLVAVTREVLAELDEPTCDVCLLEGAGIAIADVDFCRQMLINLVANARHYGDGAVAIEIAADGDTVEVVVIDEGDGVPEFFREQLFDRFTRASSVQELPGTGLGLAIVRELAQLQGGDARYEPAATGGSRFALTLPAA
ncbi:MAG: multi-sensor signal transduction histidine kinase [Thermoleophilia bacterium]|nr:multi-sensor signal transduction histidine kinase [Thermoleophilia bacterium]